MSSIEYRRVLFENDELKKEIKDKKKTIEFLRKELDLCLETTTKQSQR